MEWVFEHPIFQSSIRWEDGGSRAACLHLASLFGLRSARAQGLVRPLACLPGVWDQSASGSQRRPEHSRERQRAQWGRAGPSGANAARRGIRSLRISRIYAGECQSGPQPITQQDVASLLSKAAGTNMTIATTNPVSGIGLQAEYVEATGHDPHTGISVSVHVLYLLETGVHTSSIV